MGASDDTFIPIEKIFKLFFLRNSEILKNFVLEPRENEILGEQTGEFRPPAWIVVEDRLNRTTVKPRDRMISIIRVLRRKTFKNPRVYHQFFIMRTIASTHRSDERDAVYPRSCFDFVIVWICRLNLSVKFTI